MREESLVVIIFPDGHPHSAESRQTMCPDCRERLERQMATWSLRCPSCLALLPSESVYCAWCARGVRCLAN